MNYELLLPHELESAIAKTPVAYLPWGAHEWHGVHCPLGLDGLKARFLAEELCKEVGGVVFPAVFCGHTTIATRGFPHCLEFSESTIAALAREYLDGLARTGFKVIVIVLGHWGARQGHIIRDEVERFNARSEARAWAVQEDEMTAAFGFPEDHGGSSETSLIMAYLPDRIDLSRLPPDRPLDPDLDGISGEDPRLTASTDRGLECARIYVREAAAHIKSMLR